MSFWVALRKELLEQWRTLRLLIIVVVFVVFGLSSPLLAKLTPEILKLIPEGEAFAAMIPSPTMADAVAQYLKNLTQFGVILALLMGMGALAQEKDKGTLAMILVKPMPRGAVVLAKFVALAISFGLGIGLAAAAGYYYTMILFEPLDLAGWVALNGLLWLYVLVHVAVTVLASALTRSQVVAGGLGFGAVVILSVAGAIPPLGKYLPGQLLSWGASLVAGNPQVWWPAVAASLGIILCSLIVAWLALERQEL
jgi:ABC-2 type transport system permease protein